MSIRLANRFVLSIMIALLVLNACTGAQGSATPVTSPLSSALPATSTPQGAYPGPLGTALFPAETPTSYPAPAVETQINPPLASPGVSPTKTIPAASGSPPTSTLKPLPQATQNTSPLPTTQAVEPSVYPPPGGTEIPAYPPPSGQPTAETYPGPGETPTPGVSQPTASPSPAGATPTITGNPAPTQLLAGGTVPITATQTMTAGATSTPTEVLPALRPTEGPRRTTTVTIWHSWPDSQVQVLEQAIQAFQSSRPEVSFTLRFIPSDELEGAYASAAYLGEGPTLVLGPSDWGASFLANNLVEDVTPYISEDFRATLNPVALGSVQFRKAVFGLPFGLRGPVLYRNQNIISQPPNTFNQMLDLGKQATHAGRLGLYLDWGMAFSGGYLQGLGGQWLDETGAPVFDRDQYKIAFQWLDLLKAAKSSGAGIEINGTRDLTLFKDGKIGMMVESSGQRYALAESIGAKNLAIDPWPLAGSGRLAGFVYSDVVYINRNAAYRQALEHEAGLQFMGLLMVAPVQERLAEVGFIPAVEGVRLRDPLATQAAAAFAVGVPFPPVWQGEIRSAYWSTLGGALKSILDDDADPRQTLQSAFAGIKERLKTIPPLP